MLVLTRRKEETIVIGDTIQITVLGIRGEQVRLGITAPPEISVHRKEIYDSLAQTNRAALRGSGGLRSLLKMLRGKPAPPPEALRPPPRSNGPRARAGAPRPDRGPRGGGSR